MMQQTYKRQRTLYSICGHCISVLSNFKIGRCPGCRFVTRYMDKHGTIYFVAADQGNQFRTFFRRADEMKAKPYLKLMPQYSFAEAQSFLNHFAAERNWKDMKEAAEP